MSSPPRVPDKGSLDDEPTTDSLPGESESVEGGDWALPFVPSTNQVLPPTAISRTPPSPKPPRRKGRSRLVGAAEVVRVATIAAELTVLPAAAVFAKHGLTQKSFAAIERDWMTRIADAMERGDHALSVVYDESFAEARALARGDFGAGSLVELQRELDRALTHSESAALEMDVADAMRFRRLARHQ